MAALDLTVVSSVLAMLRRDLTPRCVADRFGVTEAEVLEWQDIFLAAGVLALAEFRRGGKVFAHLGQGPYRQTDGKGGLGPPTTSPPEPPPPPGPPTTTPEPPPRCGPLTTTSEPTTPSP